MIDKYYKTISLLRYNQGGFGTPSGYEVAAQFKGLVQAPSNSNTFNNGKDTSSVAGVLFCPISVKLEPRDVIESDGVKYIVAGQGTQPNGVTGITPKAGQHAEYNLTWTQEGI